MKKFLVSLTILVMLFGCFNVYAEQIEPVEPEYNTCISGDIALNFNDEWQPGFTLDVQHMFIPPDITYVQMYANIHIKGNTDADSLILESDLSSSINEKIEIDANGNFDQEVKLILTSFNSIQSDTINFGAYVKAIKGDKTLVAKIGKGELKTNLLIDANKSLNQNNDGIVDALDFAAFRLSFLDDFASEYNEMEEQESIKAYIYNEWYMKDYVIENDKASFTAQIHLKVKTDAKNITLDMNKNGTVEKYEYLPDITGRIDEIKEITGTMPVTQASDIAVFATIKACKGNREIELISNLKEREADKALVGDVEGNKAINSIDFMYMRKYIMGQIEKLPVESGFYCADVDDSKQINSIDFAYVRKYLLGMIKDFPKKSDSVVLNTPTPTPPVTITPTPSPGTGMETYYYVNNIDVDKYPGVEIFVDKSPMTKVWISARTVCRGPLYADGWDKTYFRLEGNAVKGVDYEEIDFDYFWREVGSGFMATEDDNPKHGFNITPIDTGTDETKDLEIYFGNSVEPAAIIHFVKDLSDIKDEDKAKEIEETPIDSENYYVVGCKTEVYNFISNNIRFYTKNYIAEKKGNPTAYPTFYQPKDIFYMEKGVPSSLKVIKNLPVCNFPVNITNYVENFKPETEYYYGYNISTLLENSFITRPDYSNPNTPTPTPPTDITPTPTPPITFTPTSSAGTGMVTYYEVNGIDVNKYPGVEIFVEKSPMSKIRVSARTECKGPLYADGWARTYFSLGGNSVNGVDYEEIDFDYFWREIGTGFMDTGDDNPREEFYITAIDTGTDETKDLEIYFGGSKPDAIIHFVDSIGDLQDEDRAKETEALIDRENYYGGDSETFVEDFSCDSVEFYTQNFIATKVGNPTKFPAFYDPRGIYYMEKDVPTSLKVIMNPPICNFPTTIHNTIYGLKPNTTYYYGNEIYYLTKKSFTTKKDEGNEY